MITITAHTEPVVPIPVSSNQPVSEPQQIYEPEENEKQTESGSHVSFAEILAGLINGKVTAADSSGTDNSEEDLLEHFNMLTGYKNGNDLDIELSDAGLLEDIEIVRDMDIDFRDQTDFTDQMITGIFEKELKTDFSTSAGEAAFISDELSPEELAMKNNKASLVRGNEADRLELAAGKASGASADRQIEEALAAEKAADKKRVTEEKNTEDKPKSDKISEDKSSFLSSLKNLSRENSGSEFAHNRREDQSQEKGGRLDELRKLSRRDRVAFEIRDQRTMADVSQSRSFSMTEASVMRVTDASLNEITLELRIPEFNTGQAQTTWEAKAATAMESMLARELHQNLNGDIVRHASMALRDGGESVIKLALKPETLGNVKIQLEMADNKVIGVILVESEEALNAFKKEIAALEQAFRESGFEDANLDLSLSDEGNNQWQQEDNSFPSKMAAIVYEDTLRDNAEFEYDVHTDAFGRVINGERSGSVNMLA